MSYLTVYCVQTFREQGRSIERADRTSHGGADAALAQGSAAAGKARGVLVYSVEIDPYIGAVGRVRVLAQHGSVA